MDDLNPEISGIVVPEERHNIPACPRPDRDILGTRSSVLVVDQQHDSRHVFLSFSSFSLLLFCGIGSGTFYYATLPPPSCHLDMNSPRRPL